MELKYRVWGRISRSVSEVFEAVVDPDQLSQYFTTGGASGRLEKGARVTWRYADFPNVLPVEVVDLVENELIVLHWKTDEQGGRQTEVDDTLYRLRRRGNAGRNWRNRLEERSAGARNEL